MTRSPAAPPDDAEIGRRALWLSFLPGLLAGAQLSNLLFFLNPRLPFSPLPLLRTMLVWGGLFGIAGALLLAPFAWRRPGRAARLLPWAVGLAFSLSAFYYWTHATRFNLYLPPGINARLIKAAGLLTLGAVVFLYTAWLHTVRRLEYGRKARIGLVLAASASLFALAERREAFDPPVSEPLPSAVEQAQRPALFMVGLDGATLDAILPLVEQGQLPFFSRLIDEGAHARLLSISPPRRAALWTTLATGKHPDSHGVAGSTVYRADFISPGAELTILPEVIWTPKRALGLVSRPLDTTSRHAITLWEILARLGLSTGVIDWPATYPVSEGPGFTFSDRYFQGVFSRAAAAPPELAERGVLFQVAADEIDLAVAELFGAEVPLDLLRTVAGDLWRESLGSFLIEQSRDMRAFFMILPGLDFAARHYFAGFSAVQFGGAQRPVYREAARFVTAYYRHLDAFLAETWERVPGPKVLAVVSARGSEAPSGWFKALGVLRGRPLEGSMRGAPDGVLFLLGDGIAAETSLGSVDLVDVMPTLLYSLGFPIARDLDGRVLTPVFEPGFLARQPLTFVPSYETLAGHRSTTARVSRP